MPPRTRRSNKNWFDIEEEAEADIKSLHSSDLSLHEVESTARLSDLNLGNPRGTSNTEISAGFRPTPGWDTGVQVTRQVLVETMAKG